MVKLGECFLKYSFLATLTRLVSWLDASEWLCLSTLYQGGTSHHLEIGAFLWLPWMWSFPEVCCPQGLGRVVTFWVWGSVQVPVQEELLKQMVAW